MDFRLTEEQEMLAETVGALLRESCTGTDLRRLLDSGAAVDQERWGQIVTMGLTGVMVSEALGGSNIGQVEMALIALDCGYWALPEPLVEQAGVVIPMLAGLDDALCARAVVGVCVAIGHPANPFVADADSAVALLLADGDALHLVRRQDVELTRQPSFDPFRRLFRVDWTPVPDTVIAQGLAAKAALDAALDRGTLFAAAQLLGIAQRAIDMTADYAKERQQFGKPIGSFQAIKHHLANAQVKVEFARPVVLAAAAMAPSDLARTRISHAKLAAVAAADAATHAAVQIHGAMGFSWEVDVHFLLKRSLALGQAWGTTAFHKAHVANHILSASLGPDRTFDTSAQREFVHERA
ncbi:MAG: acyl-CoA dehydrogenase [Sphingomonadales bacterium]